MKTLKIKSGILMTAAALCVSLSLSSCAELLSTSTPQKKKTTTTATTVSSSSSTSSSSTSSTTTVGNAKADGSTSKGRSSVAK